MAESHAHRPQPSISPDEGRRIVARFIDAETGLLVILQVALDVRSDPLVYYTVIDPQSGLPITPHARMQQLGDAEQSHVDHVHQLRLTTRRVVDAHTGGEFCHETVIDLQTGEQVAHRHSMAFAAQPRKTALEHYLEALEARRAEQHFWATEYPLRSFEDQCGYWLGYFYRTMRTTGEMGEPEYTIFTPANYREWKVLDPQFDRILRYLLNELPRMFGGDPELTRRISALLETDANA